MDKQTLAVMIPMVVMLIPLSAVILSGWQKIIKLRIEEAKAHGVSPESAREVESLRGEIDQIRIEVGEMQERLDFTERLLAKTQREQLPRPQDDRPTY